MTAAVTVKALDEFAVLRTLCLHPLCSDFFFCVLRAIKEEKRHKTIGLEKMLEMKEEYSGEAEGILTDAGWADEDEDKGRVVSK